MTARLAKQNMSSERLRSISEQVGRSAMEHLRLNHVKTSTDAHIVEIARRALELDIEMSVQKAEFRFSYLEGSFEYNAQTMDLMNDEEGDEDDRVEDYASVELYLAPALYKYNTPEGGNCSE